MNMHQPHDCDGGYQSSALTFGSAEVRVQLYKPKPPFKNEWRVITIFNGTQIGNQRALYNFLAVLDALSSNFSAVNWGPAWRSFRFDSYDDARAGYHSACLLMVHAGGTDMRSGQ